MSPGSLAPVGVNVTDQSSSPTRKLLGALLALFVCVLTGTFLYIRSQGRPPGEKELTKNFYAHRDAYERLRTMLEADKQLLRLAGWGVETTGAVGVHVPPEGDFPVSRYHEYLTLLKEIGGTSAFRGKGEHSEMVGIGMWAAGWGGDTRHIDIVWTDREPPNLIASLEDYYRNRDRSHPVFRHIEGNWYLWAD